jgi:hypothetical protein
MLLRSRSLVALILFVGLLGLRAQCSDDRPSAVIQWNNAALQGVRDRYENLCDSLRDANVIDLFQFLSGVVPDEKNGGCVTWAIHRLGNEHYDPAIPGLVKLLGFRRPQTSEEKMGFYIRPQTTDEIFPAAEALELMGKKALPEILRAIEADGTSAVARENAIFVWMEIHKYEQPKGVALLKQEEARPSDDAIKRRLRMAVQKAVTYCNPPDAVGCRQAAATGGP